MWFDPPNPKRMIVANDGGVNISATAARTGTRRRCRSRSSTTCRVDSRHPVPRRPARCRISAPRRPERHARPAASPRPTGTTSAAAKRATSYSDPSDPEHRLCRRVPRHHHALRPSHAGIAQRQRVAGEPVRPRGGEHMQYRFQWTAPIAGLAARSEGRLPRRAGDLPHPRRRAELGRRSARDLTRNDKSKQKWTGGPITGRQHRRRDLRHRSSRSPSRRSRRA